MHLREHEHAVDTDSHTSTYTHRPAPALVRGVCSPSARLPAWRPESHRGEAGLTAASDAGWQSLVGGYEQNCNVLKIFKHTQINT